MDSFTFYINADQCLNMANFDMFFYQLTGEDRFFSMNATMAENMPSSVEMAFWDIRSYLDRSPFQILDYRMIIGLREQRQEKETWKSCTLHKLLRICYGMNEARLFARASDARDRNISVIQLFDMNMTRDIQDLKQDYEVTDDIRLFLQECGISYSRSSTVAELRTALEKLLEEIRTNGNHPLHGDAVTERFLGSSCSRLSRREKENSVVSRLLAESERMAVAQEQEDQAARQYADEEGYYSSGGEDEVAIMPFVNLAKELVGDFTILRREIDRNNQAQSMMTFLGLVEYITSVSSADEQVVGGTSRRRLRDINMECWTRAMKDEGQKDPKREKYGKMLFLWQEHLSKGLEKVESDRQNAQKGPKPGRYLEPALLESADDKEEYGDGTLLDGLAAGLKRLRSAGAHPRQEAMDSAYESVRTRLSELEVRLRKHEQQMALRYRTQAQKRRNDLRTTTDERFSEAGMEERLLEAEQIREKVRSDLKEAQQKLHAGSVSPGRVLEHMESGYGRIRELNERMTRIRITDFFVTALLLVICTAAGHGIAQIGLLTQPEAFTGWLCAFALCAVLVLFASAAPKKAITRRIRSITEEMCAEAEECGEAYADAAQHYSKYMNVLNNLDSISLYIWQLQKKKEAADRYARQIGWHKARLQAHRDKLQYFKPLYDHVKSSKEDSSMQEISIDYNSGVTKNPVYWPQSGFIGD